jgi:uncharacterized protein YkwD
MSARLARTSLLLAALAGALVAGPTNAAAPVRIPPVRTLSPQYDAAGTARLYALVNAHRSAKGLRTLSVHPRLAAIAKDWSMSMARTGDFAHNDALFTKASHQSLGMATLGENVAFNHSVEAAHLALLNSPHHLYNIELPAFAVAGFAVVIDGTGRNWVTEDFGSAPRAPAPAKPVAKPVPRPVARPTTGRVQAAPKAAPKAAPAKPVAKPAAKPAKPVAAPALRAAPRPTPRVDAPAAVTVAMGSTTAAAPATPPGGGLPWLPWLAVGLLATVTSGWSRLRA